MLATPYTSDVEEIFFASPRAAVLQARDFVAKQKGALAILVGDAAMRITLEKILALQAIDFVSLAPKPISQSPIWRAYELCSRLIAALESGSLIGERVAELAILPEFGVDPVQLSSVKKRLNELEYDASLDDVIAQLEPISREFSTLLSRLPRFVSPLPFSAAEREKLLMFVATLIVCKEDELTLLANILQLNLKSSGELFEAVATEATYPQGSEASVQVLSDPDQLRDDESRILLVGPPFFKRELADRKVVQCYRIDAQENEQAISVGEQLTAKSIGNETTQPVQIDPPHRLSTTAIGQYALCPYRYFAGYQLALRRNEEKSYWLMPRRQLGDIVHRALEDHLPRAIQGNEITEEDLEQSMRNVFKDGIRGVFQSIDWQRMRVKVLEFINSEAEQMRALGEKVSAVELAFELPLRVDSAQLKVIGRIDRVDQLAGGECVVVDYKTSGGSVGPQEREQMQQLIAPQLAIYLLALAQQEKWNPVGAVEIHIRSGKRGGLVRDTFKSRFKSQTFEKIAEDEFLPAFMQRLESLLTGLLAGEIEPMPKVSQRCGLGSCPYWGLCRYDLNPSQLSGDANIN